MGELLQPCGHRESHRVDCRRAGCLQDQPPDVPALFPWDLFPAKGSMGLVQAGGSEPACDQSRGQGLIHPLARRPGTDASSRLQRLSGIFSPRRCGAECRSGLSFPAGPPRSRKSPHHAGTARVQKTGMWEVCVGRGRGRAKSLAGQGALRPDIGSYFTGSAASLWSRSFGTFTRRPFQPCGGTHVGCWPGCLPQ
jgi:hypothetical protein